MRLKDIKNIEAKDLTNMSSEVVYDLVKKGVETVAISTGVYGVNGWLGQAKDGTLYKITKRNGNLFIVL